MSPTTLNGAYYSLAEAAELLGVSERTVRRSIAAGDIEARRIGKRLLRIPAHALAAAGRPVTIPAAQR